MSQVKQKNNNTGDVWMKQNHWGVWEWLPCDRKTSGTQNSGRGYWKDSGPLLTRRWLSWFLKFLFVYCMQAQDSTFKTDQTQDSYKFKMILLRKCRQTILLLGVIWRSGRMLACMHSFIHSFIQPIFPEHSQYVRHCCRHWGYTKEQNRPLPSWKSFTF